MAQKKTKEEANYEKPASLLDLEARQAEDYVPPGVVGRTSDAQLSENGYVAVDPIYQNFADETHRPGFPEEGAEAEVWKSFVSEDVDTSIGGTPEDVSAAQEQRDSEDVYTADGATVKASRPTVRESQEQWDEANADSSSQESTSQEPSSSGGSTPPSSQTP